LLLVNSAFADQVDEGSSSTLAKAKPGELAYWQRRQRQLDAPRGIAVRGRDRTRS
jgi:hypothetical protein